MADTRRFGFSINPTYWTALEKIQFLPAESVQAAVLPQKLTVALTKWLYFLRGIKCGINFTAILRASRLTMNAKRVEKLQVELLRCLFGFTLVSMLQETRSQKDT